ncbi:unnamed protein product [Calypogeia fissa]
MAMLRETFASAPLTERGSGILIAGDVKTKWIAYANGRSVILRNLANPLEVDVYGEHSYNVTVARFSPNGEWVASGDVSGTVRIWGIGPEHPLKFEIKALSGKVDDLDWSFDGQRILVCGDAKGTTFLRAFMWDSGSNVGEFDGHSKRVLTAAFKPSRPFAIVSGGEDFLVNFYTGPPFRFKTSHREHSNFVNCIRYSPDGTKFITLGSDKKGVIFEGRSGEKLGELSGQNGHTGSIYAASWSPDSKKVLTVSADKTAKVWEISEAGSGTVITTFSLGSAVMDMQVGCLWLGDYLITVSLGGNITYLSMADPSRPLNVVSGHLKSITAITIARDGDETEIVSSSYDSVVIRWALGSGYVGKVAVGDFMSSVKKTVVAGGKIYVSGLDNKVFTASLSGDNLLDKASIDLGAQIKDLDVVSASKGDLALVTLESELVLLQRSKVLSRTPLSYIATAGALAPDGRSAVAGGQNGKLYVYSIDGDTLIEGTVLEKHRGPVTVVRFSPDGSMIASGDQNREAVVWSKNSGNWQVKVKNMLYHTARITTLAWSPDSLSVATGSVDTSVYVYDVTKAAATRTVIKNAHLGGVTAVAFVNDTTLVTGGDDSCLRVWNL